MNRNTITFLSVIGCMVLVVFNISELKAPEISERDRYGYEPFHVAESGAIIDEDGVIQGWVKGNTVFDTHWNEKYSLHNGKVHRIAGTKSRT